MSNFSYGKYKNTLISNDDDITGVLKEWAEYICEEHSHGKIPLIIAGAGVSASNVKIVNVKEDAQSETKVESYYIEKGLPCLQEMMQELKKRVMTVSKVNDKEFNDLKRQFEIMTDDMQSVDREWMGRIFTIFEKSKNELIRKIWNEFCSWFFFSCMVDEKNKCYGALNAKTSKAAEEIAVLYDSVDAICLSANFDNFIKCALVETEENKTGIAIFERSQAEDYLKRNRRGKKKFEDKPYNRCVLHANGDVFWLSCSGEKGEGYCPNTKLRRPAFDSGKITCKEDLVCEICLSPLVPTMTMPGTYEKDYNTRNIIETIWKYLSTRISAIITVGISCNWDDILLKFIMQLMSEMSIPLLDINNFVDKALNGKTQLVEIAVKQSYLEACSVERDACDGLKLVNEAINRASSERKIISNGNLNEQNYTSALIGELQKHEYIKRLCKVSQLGLKSFWLDTIEKNERWSHSKEVADIAVEMYKKILLNSRKNSSMYEQILIYTAGLLHDCGHLPFSHLLEDVFEELSWCMQGESTTFKHSHYTKWVINRLYKDSDCNLKKILDDYSVRIEDVIGLIEGRYGVSYIDMLINSTLDADKIAYIFTDAEKSNRNLALNKNEFLEKFLSRAYITQEGMVAFDGESAWYAMRLLDERKRMYEELYYDTRVRCLETMAKYIITTYFVQKYNNTELIHRTFRVEDNETIEDLGNMHVLDAIDDLYRITDDSSYNYSCFSNSIGNSVKDGIKRCMKLILSAKHASSGSEPDELKILQKMCYQLLGEEVTMDEEYRNNMQENYLAYVPYHDTQLDILVEKLSYEQLVSIRKKIMLNYPGTIIIDIYKTARYLSPSVLRAAHKRLDGTECEQVTILVPKGNKEEWKNQECHAEISLAEYAEQQGIDRSRKTIFHVFCIGSDMAACEHAINMMKKEMEYIRR